MPVLLTRKEELKLMRDLHVKEKIRFKYNLNPDILLKEILIVFLLMLSLFPHLRLLSSIVFFSSNFLDLGFIAFVLPMPAVRRKRGSGLDVVDQKPEIL